jgi:hypothetical protein
MSRHRIKIGNREIHLPRSRGARIAVGSGFVAGGVLGFLPILGFWMVPVGLVILSVDIPAVRRRRRRLVVWWGRRRERPNTE